MKKRHWLCIATFIVALAALPEGRSSVLSIRASGASSWIAESECLDVVESGSAALEVRVQNISEEAKAIRIRQVDVTAAFETTYAVAGQDITTAMLGAGWSTPVLDPGASVYLDMTMRSTTGEVGSEGTVSLEGTWDETVAFEIEDGGTVPSEDYNVDVTILGCAMSYGGDYDMPITATVCIGNESYTPWGNPDSVTQANLNDGRNPRTFSCPGTHEAGTPVWVRSTCWYKAKSYYDGSSDSHWVTYRDVDSSPATSRVHVLRNGDRVPDVEGYLNQADLAFFVRDYVRNGRIVLTENQTIYLFEYTSYLTSVSADFQDLVVLVTLSAAGSSDQGGEVATAPMEVWGVDDSSTRLRYYVIGENVVAKRDDGELLGVEGGRDVEALTFADDGSIFFMNNVGTCELYQIPASQLDHSSGTPVTAQYIGDTGLPAGTSDHEITSLQFVDATLYGITKKSKRIYRIDTVTGEVTYVRALNYAYTFKVGALTQGSDGKIYIVRYYSGDSRLYRFSSFPDGSLSLCCTFSGSGAIHAVSAHPNGGIYATDGERWYRYDPDTDEITFVDALVTDLEGMDFNYRLEAAPPSDPDGGDEGGGEQAAEVYTLAVTLVVQEAERHQADLHVAVDGAGFVGDDTHATLSGAPVFTATGDTRSVVNYELRVENDGNREEQLCVKLPEALSHSQWIVRFFAGGEGGDEITDAVSGGGWLTEALAPGASTSLRVEVVPGAVGEQLSLAVGAGSSTAVGQGLDVVRLLTVRGVVGGRVRVRSWREIRD